MGPVVWVLLGFGYGLIPGYFIQLMLAYPSAEIFSGIATVLDSSMGAIGFMFISAIVGVIVFPIAIAVRNDNNSRFVLSVFIHTITTYILIVLMTLNATPVNQHLQYPTHTPVAKGIEHLRQGEKYLDQEDYIKAIESFAAYINLNPSDARVYMKRGEAHRLLEQYQEAIHDYDKSLDLDHSSIWPYHYKGMAYEELEQYELAIQSWERYIEVRLLESANWKNSEQAANAYCNIGFSYIELGQNQKAIDNFNKALVIDPNYLCAVRGKEQATETTSTPATATPTPLVASSTSEIARRINQHLEAARDIWDILRKDSFMSGSERTAKGLEAISHIDQAIQLDPLLHEAYQDKALIYKEIGMCEDSVLASSMAINLNPTGIDGYIDRMECYRTLGENALGLEQKSLFQLALNDGLEIVNNFSLKGQTFAKDVEELRELVEKNN